MGKLCFKKLVLLLKSVILLVICLMIRADVYQLLILRDMNIYVYIYEYINFAMNAKWKKNCYQTTSCVFYYVFLSHLCLMQHSRKFSECKRKLLVGDFLSIFLYAQKTGGISELFLSILNTAVIVIEQVTVMTKGFGFHA